MINLKTNCNTCNHSEVCKKKDIPDYVREKIDDMVSKRIVLDEFDAVNIDISCPNFKRETFQKKKNNREMNMLYYEEKR